jgi:hypothetical protein
MTRDFDYSCSCSRGETMSLNCYHCSCSSFRWYVSMETRWSDTDRGEPKNLGEKPVSQPFCPSQIPHELTQARTRPPPKPCHGPLQSLIQTYQYVIFLFVLTLFKRISFINMAMFMSMVLFYCSFPLPFLPLQRRGCLVAPWFLWVVFSNLCGWLLQRQGWRVKGRIWLSKQARSAKANSWLDYQRPLEK